MPRGALVRLLLVVGLLAGCAALALTQEPRLGLDLRGGTQITLQASDSPSGVVADAEATDRAIEVLRGRVDALGYVGGRQRRLVPEHLHHGMFGF